MLTRSLLSDRVVSADDIELVRIRARGFMAVGDLGELGPYSSLSLGGSRDLISIILRTAC